MAKKIGEFIHDKFKSKGLEDKQVAGFLNISPSTLRKTFLADDLYISRLIKCSKLIGDDVIAEYYYSKEPLRSFHEAEIKKWSDDIEVLKSAIDAQKKTISHLEDHIDTQRELLASLKKEIGQLEKQLKNK